MRFHTLSGILIASVLFWPMSASGQDPEDVRWVDQQGASSGCLGSAQSPECAVDTALACRVRDDASLCESVGLALPAKRELPFTQRIPDPFAVVEITGVKYLIHDEGRGDSRRIGVSVRFYGKYGLNWPESGWRRLIYRIRRDGGAWRVENVSWQPWIRRIGPQEGSGGCIGKRTSPVCVVETHIACRVRDEPALCADARGLEPRHFRPQGATVLYYIDRIRRWKPPELAPSDSLFVVVWVAESTDLPAPGKADPGSVYVTRPAFVPVSYLLERREGAWRVLSRTERP
jgi:hypothetical protein